ncbi:MAG: efflux transporter outer membrane subunit [Verrucomicrobiota bacterium]|jgi:multidrug efflux system outer membrane protein
MNKNLFLLLLGLAIVPAGCTLAPKYTQPKAPVPADWPTGTAYQRIQPTNAEEARPLRWREFFTDEKLQQIIAAALTNNRDLRIAALNVEMARAQYGIQRAELLPTVNATGSFAKQRIPAYVEGFPEPMTIKSYGVNLGVASWEIDFFGRIRSLKDHALQEYLATEQARRSAQILLVSSVARAYLALAADRESLAVAENTLAAQRSTYNMVKRRHDLGLAGDLDVERAQTQVAGARRDIASFQQLIAQDENALNLLAGSPAPGNLLPAELGQVTPPKELSAGVSSDVLLRRPDVVQAEDLLKAANADIGAARAAFFPQISLTSAIGTASSDLSGLFKPGSSAWNFAPQIVMPIFDARTWSAHKAAKVQCEIALTQYEKAIQSAFREVADALAIRGTVDQQIEAQQSLVQAVAETYRLSNSRYNMGIDSYLSVLDAQRSLYAAQQGLVSLRLAKLANRVTLYAALGGGWEPPAPSEKRN